MFLKKRVTFYLCFYSLVTRSAGLDSPTQAALGAGWASVPLQQAEHRQRRFRCHR